VAAIVVERFLDFKEETPCLFSFPNSSLPSLLLCDPIQPAALLQLSGHDLVFSGQHLATSNKSHSVHQSNQVLCFLFLPTLHQFAIAPSLSTLSPFFSLLFFVLVCDSVNYYFSTLFFFFFVYFLFLLLMSSVFQRLKLRLYFLSFTLVTCYVLHLKIPNNSNID
jgi:hypothetical protein